MRNLRRILVLAALTLPLTASTCTKDKKVDVVLGVPTELDLAINSTGGQNWHQDIDAIDLRGNLDLSAKLSDAGIDPQDVKSIQVVQIFYRVTAPQTGKSVSNGLLEVTRGALIGPLFTPDGNGTVHVADGFAADLGTASPDWVDITGTLDSGIGVLNAIATDLLKELKGEGSAQNTAVLYQVSGDVTPSDTATNVTWKLKIVIQVVSQRSFEIPFG